MRRVCVFCGAFNGSKPEFQTTARRLGQTIAEMGLELVYGAGRVGLMGVVADGALASGGRVIGVIPESLVAKELAHNGLSELHIVKTMHERKALMEKFSDGFLVLPGGYGTLDEFCEILTWSQLGFHRKPCAILNINGYFDQLINFFDEAVKSGFVSKQHRDMIIISSDPAEVLNKMQSYKHEAQDKWISEADL
ncbi:MAG: TIGR00730 family Rossman fold protein [Candidatus Obscuribacterales bacterium]|jgi:uncharacterized protein (TIGR00730 family)|nr:TIGR00730 family Rossman fold protein [Candidatus Obscuribacterales bacterium]